MCAFDLTNPRYCMERPYDYKQTLPFNMMLELADNFTFSGKAQRRAKRAARQEKKVVKKQQKAARKIIKQTAKTERKDARQARRTDRVVQKGERKAIKREAKVTGKKVKLQRKENRLMRAQGRGAIIQARQQGKIDLINQRNQQALFPASIPGSSGSQTFSPGSEEQASYDWDFSPENDFVNSPQVPGSTYDAEETIDTTFELVPENEEDYIEGLNPEEEFEYTDPYINDGLSFGFIPAAVSKISNLIKKASDSKAGQVVTKGASAANSLIALKRENDFLKKELDREKKNKMISTGVAGAGGILTGILLKATVLK